MGLECLPSGTMEHGPVYRWKHPGDCFPFLVSEAGRPYEGRRAFDPSQAPKAAWGGTSWEGWATQAWRPSLSPDKRGHTWDGKSEGRKQWGKACQAVAQVRIGTLVPSVSSTQGLEAPGGPEHRAQAGVGEHSAPEETTEGQ